jgi:hypothetical protein
MMGDLIRLTERAAAARRRKADDDRQRRAVRAPTTAQF